MKSKYDDEVPLFKAGSEGTQKKWLVKGIATLAMLGGIAAASDASGVAGKVDDMFEAAIHMALEPASAATVANTTIDKATAVPSRSTTSTGKETSDYLVKGSAKYQDMNSNNNYSWYSLSNGKQQTGLVVYNTALDTKNDFTASGSFYVANYAANAADYNGILLSSILPDTLGSGTGGGGLGIQGIKNAISFGMDMYANGSTYKDASGTYPMVGIRTTDSSGNLTQASVESSLTSGSGVSSLPASSKPDGINAGTGAAWSVKYTASTKTLTFSLGGKVTKSMTINTTTMPYLSFALIGSAGDNSTEMTSSIQSVSGTKASMTVPVTYKDTAGNTLLTSTKLDVGDGQSVGINGASPKASSDTFSYDAPVVPGYYIKSANDISVKVGSGTTPSLDLVYEKSPQQATVNRTGLNASNAVKNGTAVAASGVTSGAIAIADASLAVAGYSYVVTAPDGKQYSTMSEALAAGSNGVYDSTTNSSGASDAAVQSFGVSYSALSQKANFTYSGGTPLSGAPTVTSGVTDDALPGSLFVYAPSGYRLDSASTTLASGISMTYATTMRSATITGKFDADTATDQNSTIVLKADKQTATLKQVVNAKTSDVESVTGGTDSKIAFTATDSTLAKTGYTYNVTGADGKTYDTLSAALAATSNYDNTSNDGDTDATAQVFTVNYTDTQAPTISTGKDSYQVTTGAGATADSFLKAINAQATDNQMDGSTTLTSNYADVVKDEPGTYTVTLTATDATGLKTTKTITVVVTETSPYDQESAVSSAASNLETISNDPTKTTADVQAAQKALDDAIAAADNNTGTTQAIVDATNALDRAVAVASAKAVETNPVSQETAVASAKDNLDKVLADSASTTDQIIAARDALKDAAADALEARNNALNGADTAISNASQSTAALDPDVIAAQKALQEAVDSANADTGTTDAVTKATEALNKAISDAQADQAAARAAAAAAIAAMTPVSNEANILAASKSLQDILDNQNATADEITNATTALTNATATEKGTRSDAVSVADTAITKAQAGDNANDEGVQEAIENLQNVIANATDEKPDSDGNVPLTDDIEAATKAIADAVEQAAVAQDAARDAAGQVETAPVSNESGVKDAQSALDKVLNDPSATVEEINDATTALENAVDTANAARDSANSNADTAISNAQGTPQINEPAVQEAVEKLQELQKNAANDSSSALTQDILDAIQELSDTVAEAARDKQEAVLAAENALSQTKPVSNESATAKAISDLQALLADENSTAEAIRDATKALTAATASDTTERNATNIEAADAISAAQSSTVATDESVLTAIQNLKDAQTKAANETVDEAGHAWVSQDIVDAMRALQEAVSVAEQAQDTACDEASALVQDNSKTSPVTNEPAITAAKSALQDVIDDPNATAADLEDAMAAYQGVIDQTKTQRDNTKSSATDAITSAQGSDLSADQGVQDAIKALEDVMNQADDDSPDALTSDIQDAMKALQDAQLAAVESRNQAAELADQVKGQTAPVSQEPGVQHAVSDLDTLLNDSTATAAQINDAIKALQDAVAEANDERDAVNQAANEAATSAANSDQSQSQAVQDAITALQQAQADAANDEGTSEAIATATKQLQDAVAQEAANQATERDNAAAAMDATAPVSNETAVATAKNVLEAVLGDPKSTAEEISDAVKALTDATTTEKENRDTANTTANETIANVPAEVASEPQVAEAVANLQRLMDEAANDSSGALTKDIVAATEALTKAQDDVVGYREQARDAAADTLTKTAPVSHEPATAAAIDALNALVNDPNANYADIKQATEDLLNQVATDTQERDATTTDGNALLDQAAQSDLANDPTVVAAMDTLRNAMTTAATDTSDALTADIKAAMQALQDSMTALVDDAREQAQQAIADAKPVSNEKGVADAIKQLQTVLNDPNATRTAIEQAMTKLQNATESAKESRENANSQAQQAIQAAQSSSVSDDPAVQAAMQRLQEIIAAAALDDPDNLTADILAAMQALQSAVAKAEAEQAATDSVATQTSETPAVVTQALYGTTPIYQSGGYPVIVPGVLPYTGYESGTLVSPVLAQSLPYQATAPRTLAGETNGRRIADRISQLDDREISRAGLDTAIAHENKWLPLGIFLFSSILLLLIAKRRKQDDK
ncbi:hypothetical protein [Weissella confusa]